MIVAMVLVMLLATLSTVIVNEMTIRAKHVEVDLEDIKAFEAAEAGIDAALCDINSCPIYQPRMTGPTTRDDGTLIIPEPSRDKNNSRGFLYENGQPTNAANPNGGVALVTPMSKKPITVHVARKRDGTFPGCIGTTQWVESIIAVDGTRTKTSNTFDLVQESPRRPTWKSAPLRSSNGADLRFPDGTLRYCEDGIVPQALGKVAFFTYAIDWFHDGIDNDLDGVVDDKNERNKYTIYSTGIHRGLSQSGVTQSGKVVTIEVVVQAQDKNIEIFTPGALTVPIGRHK
ncbi:MAG TPA: hypothetical protein VEK08_16280 [Planctomycetota bacterium]|nr:hypothetical protein [Planctomycetota bacterium]